MSTFGHNLTMPAQFTQVVALLLSLFHESTGSSAFLVRNNEISTY